MKNLYKWVLAAGLFIAFSIAQAASFTDTLENLLGDVFLRGQAFSESSPVSHHVSLHTTSCTDSVPGTEVSGGSYARVPVTRSLASWTGSHGTTTGVSTGNNGTFSNAAAITFPAPTADWTPITQITSFALNDAAIGGNQLVCTDLTTPKTVNSGDAAPSFGVGALTIQIDN